MAGEGVRIGLGSYLIFRLREVVHREALHAEAPRGPAVVGVAASDAELARRWGVHRGDEKAAGGAAATAQPAWFARGRSALTRTFAATVMLTAVAAVVAVGAGRNSGRVSRRNTTTMAHVARTRAAAMRRARFGMCCRFARLAQPRIPTVAARGKGFRMPRDGAYRGAGTERLG